MLSHARRAVAFLAAVAAAAALAPGQTSRPVSFDDFGREIEAIVAARDADAFVALVDLQAFGDRVFRGMNTPVGRQIAQGVRPTLPKTFAALIEQLPADVKATFLRRRKVGAEDRLTLRLVGSAGLNYLECVVEPTGPAGALRIADVHAAITGEPLSVSLQRMLLRLTPADGNALSAAERRQIDDIAAYTREAKGGDARVALKQFDAFPEKLKREKMYHVLRILAAARVPDEPALLEAVSDEFKRRFGTDPACDLVMVDNYLTRKQYAEALSCVDRLEINIGGDAYLDVMRSNVKVLAGDLPAARRFAEAAHRREPRLYEAADSLLTIALQQNDFAEAKRMLVKIESTPAYGTRFADDLNGAEVFAAFKASPQFAEWLAERPKE